MATKIYLSPSNQYSNTYAYGKTCERDECYKIATKLSEKLKNSGFEVMLSDKNSDMYTRVTESDNYRADLHIPIHTNACNGRITGGCRIFQYSENNSLADKICKEINKISLYANGSVQIDKNLYENSAPRAKSIYIECEFHDTVEGAKWIINNTDDIATAICKAICDFYEVDYTPSVQEFHNYKVTITSENGVNIRKGAGTNYKIVGAIPEGGVYTIVAESSGLGATKWGKLKSGVGWIALDWCKKVK